MGAEKFGNKEHLLNFTALRFQLTRPRAVGPTMELINRCEPKTFKEWEEFYWQEAFTRTKEPSKITKEYLEDIGEKLYDKIQEVVKPIWQSALDEISKDDCIEYIIDVTLNRTFDGYHRENAVIRELGQYFQNALVFEKTDSVTDSSLGIDYWGHLLGTTIKLGFQIKPATARISSLSGYSVEDRNVKSFHDFEETYGGKVFVVYTKITGKKEIITNKDIFEKISKFIDSL